MNKGLGREVACDLRKCDWLQGGRGEKIIFVSIGATKLSKCLTSGEGEREGGGEG